jgi:hypothetical protein
MRFHVGPIPENQAFTPVEEAWEMLQEPSPCWAQVFAIPI